MLGHKIKVVVVGKTRYKFDDDNGVNRSGAKIFVQADPVNEADKVGVFQTDLALSKYEDFELFPTIPGEYEVEMHMQAGKSGAKFVVEGVKEVVPTK